MFFNVKKWTDRFSEYPNRRKITKTDGTTERVTVTRDEGTVSREGDKFNASTMNELESRISSFDSKISNQLGAVDDASSASEAYTVGSYIIHNGVRYKVTAAIAKGDAFNEGTNISKKTVNNQIAELNTKITSLNSNIAVQVDQNIAKEVERATAAENKLESEKANKTTATSSADGLMSAADKTKLDGINPSAIATNAENIKKNADEIAKLSSYAMETEYRLMINHETGHMALAHYTKEA